MDSDSDDKPFIGVFTTGTDLVVRVWDDAIAAMTGIDGEGAIGKHIKDLVPNVEARGLLTRFEHVRDCGTTEVLAPALHKNLFSCPPQNLSVRFKEMRQLVTISALRNGDEIEGLIVVVEDVTPRMEREKELAEHLKDPDSAVRLQAAKSIADGSEALDPDNVGPVIEALTDKNWRVRRKLVDGLAKRAAPEAVAALLEAVRKEHFDFGMLNGALQVLQETSIDTTDTLIEFLRSDDADLRMQAALALGQQKNKSAIGHLIAALDDENANVRYHAIEALGNFQADEAVDPLLAIAESRDFFLSFAALDALKQIANPRVAPNVASLLDDDLLREAATGTLGATGNIDAVEQITDLLNKGELSPGVACQALYSLFERHEEKESSGDEVIDRFRKTINPTGISALLDAVDRANTSGHGEVVTVAGWVPDERVVPRLASLLENELLWDTALAALVCHGDVAVPFLVEELRNEDSEVRAHAACALGSIGSAACVETLIKALQSDPSIAPFALDALGRSSSPKAFDALVDLLASPDKTVRRATVNTLKRFPPENGFSRLECLLDHVNPNVRESAIRFIGNFETPESRNAVLQGTQDKDSTVRIAALEHLAGFPGDIAVKALDDALDDTVPHVRATAAQTLAAFGDDESVHALHRALTDADDWVRYFAVRSLSANGGAERSAALIQKLAEGDPAEQVRVAAAEALRGTT